MLAQCEPRDLVLEKVFPAGDILIEGDPGSDNAIIRVGWTADCPAREKPLKVCVNVWETTACPQGVSATQCEGNIRGASSVHFRPNGGWAWGTGRMICNQSLGQAYDSNFDGTNDSVYNQQNLLLSISSDTIKADRQNHLIVVMYGPTRYLRIPIQDDD